MVDAIQNSGRRDFLKSGALTALGASLLGAGTAVAAAPAAKQIEVGASGIPLRQFGKTSHKLPVLGMGGSAFAQVFIAAYGVPLLTMDERVAMVRHGYESGIRYFDTARVYGESESIVGQGLKGVRDQAFVATKVAVMAPGQVRGSIGQSLKQLEMERVDLVQIHSPAIEAIGFANRGDSATAAIGGQLINKENKNE